MEDPYQVLCLRSDRDMLNVVLNTLASMPGKVAVEQDVKKVVGAELARGGPGTFRRLHHRWALLRRRLEKEGCIEARARGEGRRPSSSPLPCFPLRAPVVCGSCASFVTRALCARFSLHGSGPAPAVVRLQRGRGGQADDVRPLP